MCLINTLLLVKQRCLLNMLFSPSHLRHAMAQYFNIIYRYCLCPRGNLYVSAAWNKDTSAFLVSTVLFTSAPHRFVYEANVQHDKHSECRHKPVLLVWSIDWRSSVPVIPSITKASRILTTTATFSRQAYSLRTLKASEIMNIHVFLDHVAFSTDENLPAQPPPTRCSGVRRLRRYGRPKRR
jgi:hypothetical protein